MTQINDTQLPLEDAPQWLADEYEQANDGQFLEALQALKKTDLYKNNIAGLAADIGCGSGRLAAELAHRGWSVDATDVSKSMISKTIERCNGLSVNANVCDAKQLVLKPNIYDLVTSFWMLHWLKDATHTLEQMAAAVKPGGCIAIQWSCSQPNAEGFLLRDTLQEVFMSPKWKDRLKDAPLAMFQHSLEDVSAFFLHKGFEVVSIRENINVAGGENPESLKKALRAAAFAAQTVVLGDDVDQFIDECLTLLFSRNAMNVANSELIVRLKY